MDRCALFVDAGYVLADGAMAVHGTHRRESVSWDYAGLTQFLAGLASERSGLPLLRSYWYEATVEGRRTEEHDTLADLPGVKLRLAKMRPGRREGVESEIHRDLTTLARNKAVTDAMVISAEEDLAQVVADVQDLGMRVTLLHIAVEGNGAVPPALRQECDDIAEINSAHLRPYVELISGAEPPRTDEQDGGSLIVFRPAANGHGQPAGAAPYPPAQQETDNGYQAPPGYAAPAAAPAPAAELPADELPAAGLDLASAAPSAPDVQPEQQDAQPAQQLPGQQEPQLLQQEPLQQESQPVQQEPQPVQQEVTVEQDQPAEPAEPAAPAAEYLSAPPGLAVVQPEQGQAQSATFSPAEPSSPAEPQEYVVRPDWPAGGPEFTPRPEMYGAPVAVPAPPAEQPVPLPAARNRATDLSEYRPGAIRMQPPRDPVSREPLPAEPGSGYQPAAGSAQVHRLPTRGAGQPAAAPPPPPAPPLGVPGASGPAMPPPPGQPMPVQSPQGQPLQGQPLQGQPLQGQPGVAQPAAGPFGAPQPEPGQPPAGQYGAPAPVMPNGGPASVTPIVPDVGYPAHDVGHTAPRNGSYTGPRPVAPLGPGGGAAPVAPWGQPPAGGFNGPSGPIGPGVPVGLGGQPAPNPLAPPPAITPQADPGGQSGPQPGPGLGVPGGPLGPAGPAYSATQPGVSLADAVQSAHQEGQEFGESVARDAPALWLEAVLARKPRMPSDLEARLLQGSALPIDFLLHDEVRHALRRGFWDALERARR